ncbi:MAG: Sec-independent protein translocase protein TatB [bacterium]
MSLIPQIGMLELVVIAMLALIVVGPKDLPRLLKGVGKFLAQMRAMADEFRAGFDQMAREMEMEEMRNEIEALKKANPVNDIKTATEEAMAPLDKPFHKVNTPPTDHHSDRDHSDNEDNR